MENAGPTVASDGEAMRSENAEWQTVPVSGGGLQLTPIVLGDFAAEDDGDLVRLSNGSISAYLRHW